MAPTTPSKKISIVDPKTGVDILTGKPAESPPPKKEEVSPNPEGSEKTEKIAESVAEKESSPIDDVSDADRKKKPKKKGGTEP